VMCYVMAMVYGLMVNGSGLHAVDLCQTGSPLNL